jgi:hypothetical protein
LLFILRNPPAIGRNSPENIPQSARILRNPPAIGRNS